MPFFDLFIQENCSGLSPSSCLAGGDQAWASGGWGQQEGKADRYCSVLTEHQATSWEGRRTEQSEAIVQLVSDKELCLECTNLPFLLHFHLVKVAETRLHAFMGHERLLQILRVSEYKISFKQLLFLIPVEVSQEAASGLSIGPRDFCGLFSAILLFMVLANLSTF